MGNAYLYTNEPYKAKPFLTKSLELNSEDAHAQDCKPYILTAR